jgi:transposase
MVKNHLHAEQSEAEPNESSILRINTRINFLSGQEKEIKEEIENWVNKDSALKQEIENICTIPGIGELTAVIILAETNGFELIRNKRQLTSYAGLDVKEKQSGTSIKGKPRISKIGNRHLRKAMHLPSLTAVRWDDNYRDLYARIISKQGIKMKALIAVQRKLLEMVYTIFKNKCPYDKEYETKRIQKENSVHAQMA